MKNDNDNKEMQLLTALGKAMVKYMDYLILLLVFPIIFDVKIIDPKIFIALGTLIFIRAIMPIAYSIAGIEEKSQPQVTQVKVEQPHVLVVPQERAPGKYDNVMRETEAYAKKVTEEKFAKKVIEDKHIRYSATVDATDLQRSMIRFTGENYKAPVQINTKKVDGDFVIISFPDFRTLKVHKDEMEQLYIAILESEYGFFKPGKWYLELRAKDQQQESGL